VALDATHVIEALAVPTLLIWGENDDLVPLSLGQQLCERLSHIQARLFIIKRANHVCMFERPEQFNAAILAFLEQPAQDTLAMPYVSQRERHC
jgi:pimeloyl-ACP methyl ester carboxylesterase